MAMTVGVFLLRAFDGHAEQASMVLKPMRSFDQNGQHLTMLCTFNFDVKAKRREQPRSPTVRAAARGAHVPLSKIKT